MRITMTQRVMIAIAVLLLLGSCGAQLAARAAQSAATAAGDKAKQSAAAAGVTVTPLPAPKDVAESEDQVKYWHDQADQARQEAAADRSKAKDADARAEASDEQAKVAEKRTELLRIQLWQTRLAWTAGMMLLGILVGVALEFILPAGMRGWASTGIMVCVAIAIVCMALRIVLPWLVIVAQAVAWLLAIAVIGGLLYVLAKALKAVLHATQHGDRMEGVARSLSDWVGSDVVEHLISKAKAESAAVQASSGVRNLIDLVRGRPKDRPQPAVIPMPAVASGAAAPASPASSAPTQPLAAMPSPPATDSGTAPKA